MKLKNSGDRRTNRQLLTPVLNFQDGSFSSVSSDLEAPTYHASVSGSRYHPQRSHKESHTGSQSAFRDYPVKTAVFICRTIKAPTAGGYLQSTSKRRLSVVVNACKSMGGGEGRVGGRGWGVGGDEGRGDILEAGRC